MIRRKEIKNLTKVKLSYLAGLIDGEGSFGIEKSASSKYGIVLGPRCCIINSSLDLLKEVQSWFGYGLLNISDKKQYNHRSKPSFRLSSCKRKALLEFLPLIIPHLRLKKRKTQILLDFLRHREEINKNGRVIIRNSRGQITKNALPYTEEDYKEYEELRKLNQRGRRE